MNDLRRVQVHTELLERAASHVPDNASVLDLGCGIGLLIEHLPSPSLRYLGLDISPEFVSVASRRYASRPGVSFRVADLASSEVGDQFDVVTLLNTLNLFGVGAVELLRKACRALRPGGRLVVSGPFAGEGYTCSLEGMVALLRHLGLDRIVEARNDLNHGSSYFVTAGW